MRIKNKQHIILILIMFSALIMLQHFAPKPVDWDMSFSAYRKKPYGCSVIKELLTTIFPGKDISVNNSSFYIGLRDSMMNKNIIIISNEFHPDEFDCASLLSLVKQGNSAFISSLNFSKFFCDTLKFATYQTFLDSTLFRKSKEVLKLHYIPGKYKLAYSFKRGMPDHFFTAYDTAKTIVLGTDKFNRPDFIVIRFGKGKIFIHCQPFAFSNYHILYGNHEYATTALSVLPVKNTIWDQFYKPDKLINTSPMRYILSVQELRSAYYTALAMLLLYLLFGSKRRQRIVPLITPLSNSSLEFIQSVGSLYFKSQNHADLAKMKIVYFHEFLKNRFNLKQPFHLPDRINFLSLKTGISAEELTHLIEFTEGIEKSSYLKQEELIKTHQIIEDFYKKCS
jgi:hypothetical protein